MRKKIFPAAVGGSSLLVIFAVLCLCIFSFLGLSSVRADQRLSAASAAAIEGYYQADTEAEEILARLREGDIPSGVTVNGDVYTYVCPVSDTQELQVAVRLRDEQYDVLRWQTCSTADWDPDDSLELWDGEFEA